MAKKSRKKRKRKGNAKAQRPASVAKRSAPPAGPPASGGAAAKKTGSGKAAAYSVNALQRTAPQPKPAASRTSTPDYAAEYAYVYQDLRRIALLAGSFLVVMIALTFVLH